MGWDFGMEQFRFMAIGLVVPLDPVIILHGFGCFLVQPAGR